MGDRTNTNNQNNPIQEIVEAFGLNEGEYEIKNLANIFELNEEEENEGIKENNIYCISPKQSYIEKLPIRQISNPDIFNEYNLMFEHCIFEVELLIQQKTITKSFHFMECTFKKCVNFNNSTFNANDNNINAYFKESVFESILSCEHSTFNNRVDFSKTTFNTMVSFQGTTFNEYAHFKEVDFNGAADFFNAQFKSGAVFSEAHFNYKINHKCSARFKAAKFSSYAWFKKATFCNDADFEAVIFEKDVLFNNAIFSKQAYFASVGFYGLARFSDVNFHGQVIFQGSRFKERAFFSKANFQEKATLSNLIFEHNVYFDEAEFLGEVDFNKSEFYKNTYFYKTKFKDLPKENIQEEDIPNFLQAIFNGSINLTDTPLFLFDFKDLESIIKEDSHKANEFRDTFKNMKNALIKDNNLLDASRFHKMELYAKELELKHKENSTTRDFIDRIQLIFYRLTSDHHTDLLLILNNVLALIVLFSVIVFIVFCRTTCWKYIKEKVFCNSEQDYSYFVELLKIIRGAFIENPACNEIIAIFFLCIMFVFLYIIILFSIYCFYNQFPKICFTILCIPTLFIFAVKPALILPIFGKLIDESLKIDFPAFTSLSIVYAILMFLLIFSLQKTARKNTIVPS